MQYKIIKGIMQGLIFNGSPVTMDEESRIWNNDSAGQSFMAENCVKVYYKQVNHIINGEYKFKEYYKAYGNYDWISIPVEEGENNTVTHFIELRYNEDDKVKDGYIIT